MTLDDFKEWQRQRQRQPRRPPEPEIAAVSAPTTTLPNTGVSVMDFQDWEKGRRPVATRGPTSLFRLVQEPPPAFIEAPPKAETYRAGALELVEAMSKGRVLPEAPLAKLPFIPESVVPANKPLGQLAQLVELVGLPFEYGGEHLARAARLPTMGTPLDRQPPPWDVAGTIRGFRERPMGVQVLGQLAADPYSPAAVGAGVSLAKAAYRGVAGLVGKLSGTKGILTESNNLLLPSASRTLGPPPEPGSVIDILAIDADHPTGLPIRLINNRDARRFLVEQGMADDTVQLVPLGAPKEEITAAYLRASEAAEREVGPPGRLPSLLPGELARGGDIGPSPPRGVTGLIDEGAPTPTASVPRLQGAGLPTDLPSPVVPDVGEEVVGSLEQVQRNLQALTGLPSEPLGRFVPFSQQIAQTARELAQEEGGALRLQRPGPSAAAMNILQARALNVGIDARLAQRMLDTSIQPAPVQTQLRRNFNKFLSFRFFGDLHPEVHHGHIAATEYASAQATRITEIVAGWEAAAHEAFGQAALKGADTLRSMYRGPSKAGQAVDAQIGRLSHVLENPGAYQLTPPQQGVAKQWNDQLLAELRFNTGALQLPLGEFQGAWVHHGFKRQDPNLLQKIIGVHPGYAQATGRAKPFFARERNLDTDEFAEVAQLWGEEIDNNVVDILAKRLSGTAKMRTEQMLLDTLAAKLGGGRVRKWPDGQEHIPHGQKGVDSGGRTWRLPEAVSSQVDSLIHPRQPGGVERALEEGVDLFRNFLLSFDVSIAGLRQGWLAFVADPIGVWKDYGKAWEVLSTRMGWVEAFAKHADRLEYWDQMGLSIRQTPYDISTTLRGQRPQLVERFPGIKQLNHFNFNIIMPFLKLGRAEQFSQSLRAMRDNTGLYSVVAHMPVLGPLAKRLQGKLPQMTDEQIDHEVASTITNWLGGIEWARVGRSPGLLSKTILLTEGWTRGQLGLLINAPKLGPEGIMSRRLLMQEILLTAGVATAASYAVNGELPEFDPNAQRFLDIKTPFGYVTLLPHKAMFRTLARAVLGKPEEDYGAEGAVAERIEALTRFTTTRFGQPIQTAQDIIRGADYAGVPIKLSPEGIGKYVATEFTPIVAGQVAQDVFQGEPAADIGPRAAFNFLGSSARPLTMRTKLAEELLHEPYQGQEPFVKRMIVEVMRQQGIGTGPGKYVAPEDKLEWRRLMELMELPKRFPSWGQNARFRMSQEYYDIEAEVRNKRLGLRLAEDDEWPKRMKEGAGPQQRAMQEYYLSFRDPKVLTPAGRLDLEKWTREVRRLKTTWSSEQQDYVARHTHQRPIPLAVLSRLSAHTQAEVRNSQRKREEYFIAKGRQDLATLSRKLFYEPAFPPEVKERLQKESIDQR